MNSVAHPPQPRPEPRSFRIQGGDGAPAEAREHLRAHLGLGATRSHAEDAVLLVSELVTNSVLHAQVDAHQTLVLELTTLSDHLRIAVIDPGGSPCPRLLPRDLQRPGGLGLQIVDRLSSRWGVERDSAGVTRVWCDLPTSAT